MSRAYVFWFKLIKTSAFFSNFFWNFPKELIKVVVTESHIRTDGIFEIDGNDSLSIDLSDIDEIKWGISSSSTIGYIKITTQELKNYYLIPVNPLDPTLMVTYDNINELIAFCNVVNALKTNQTPDFDENPYLRQLQEKPKPAYLNNKNDINWDKNVSPLEYYYALVPASEDKKRRLKIKIYKYIVLSVTFIAILGFLYALFTNFKW